MRPNFRTAVMGLAAISVAGCASAAIASDAAPTTADAAVARYVHEIDIPATVKPYLTPQGFLDPAFSEAIAHPSSILMDFFGNQAIADVGRDQIMADFVPRFATQTGGDEHSIKLQFRNGYTATFYPQSSLSVKGTTIPTSHVTISGTNWREIEANLADFTQTIKTAGLDRKYLIPNPYFDDEQTALKQMAGGRTATVIADPSLQLFNSKPNAVLLFGEAVHGISSDADRLMPLFGRHKIDWLGLESVPHEKQPMLDAFNAAKVGTPAYAKARAKIVTYFAENWNGRAGPKTTGEENYYFKLVEAAHRSGIKVVAVEDASLEFVIFRYGETRLGGAVRSLLWAKNTPRSGRGILFGGGAHFSFKEPGAVKYQDFLAMLSPGRTIVSLTDLSAKPQP